MSVFTSFAGGKLDLIAAGDPQISNVSMPLAATEYAVTIPAGARQYLIRTRSGKEFQIAYILGDSGTNYFTVPRNCFYAESDISLISAKTLYLQVAAAAQVLEVLVWI